MRGSVSRKPVGHALWALRGERCRGMPRPQAPRGGLLRRQRRGIHETGRIAFAVRQRQASGQLLFQSLRHFRWILPTRPTVLQELIALDRGANLFGRFLERSFHLCHHLFSLRLGKRRKTFGHFRSCSALRLFHKRFRTRRVALCNRFAGQFRPAAHHREKGTPSHDGHGQSTLPDAMDYAAGCVESLRIHIGILFGIVA